MHEPIALYVRYQTRNDKIKQAVNEALAEKPTQNLRDVVEGWIDEIDSLQKQLVSQQQIIDRLDLLIDIHNSYIIDKNIHAVYPTSLKTSDMIRGLEDDRFRRSKKRSE